MWRVTVLFVVYFAICHGIRVPIDWNNESEVSNYQTEDAQAVEISEKHVPTEYFQYSAKKPQFAIDIAAAHGVELPENYFKSHPIKPHTGFSKPELGKHQILNSVKQTYHPLQKFVEKTALNNVKPVSTSYEIYHPYKAEQPALQQIYKDPVLNKIRNDLRDSKYKLQKYEHESGQPDITEEEYLESPEQTDRRKQPHKNVPAQFEMHRPQRRPAYYRVPVRTKHREQYLNHRLRHPWNQNVKVTPIHYRPIKNYIQGLRQQHALKFDDDKNEYPQLLLPESYAERPPGYDIYEKGKDKYVKIRNNLENSINNAAQKNRPNANYLELQNNLELPSKNPDDSEEKNDEIFVPIKNYAQVRKYETTKHLPKAAAIQEAENWEEMQNAPRLREAVKSTKAQIVYSEEGYEDAAYDHAGEQKHASDHEGHGGFLKENEISAGKFKTPSVSNAYDDSNGFEHQEQKVHGEKWNDIKNEKQEEKNSSDYSEDEDEYAVDAEVITDATLKEDIDRDKRNTEKIKDNNYKHNQTKVITKVPNMHDKHLSKLLDHDVAKRETTFDITNLDLNSTLPSDTEILKLSKTKSKAKKLKVSEGSLKVKYPYYSKRNKIFNKNSPLQYAENFALMPKKSRGGTEFYDSRSNFECPEVDDDVDPIPEKLKQDGHPDENKTVSNVSTSNNDDVENFNEIKNKQRLKGLGDKIDCFKAKYFGSNPLDNPIFTEEFVDNPEPITKPNLMVFKTHRSDHKGDIFSVVEKLQNNRINSKHILPSIESTPPTNIFVKIKTDEENKNLSDVSISKSNSNSTTDLIYKYFKNQEDVTMVPIIRLKRAAPFMYEPYKIIRDSQVQDSKKTTTTSNISPLIKQLQSSRIIDKVTTADKEQTVKRNAKMYKDIGKTERQKSIYNQSNDSNNQSIVDVTSDQREPRNEIWHTNHKPTYSPVDNKKAVSVSEYKMLSKNNSKIETTPKQITRQSHSKRTKLIQTTVRPVFDVNKYIPQTVETQNIAASTNIRKVIRSTTTSTTTTSKPFSQVDESRELRNFKSSSENTEKSDDHNDDDDEKDGNEEEEEDEDENNDEINDNDDRDEDDEDDDHESDVDENIMTTSRITTITTTKPYIGKRNRIIASTSTITPRIVTEDKSESPKLRLTTRFRNSQPNRKTRIRQEINQNPSNTKYIEDKESTPKYTERKKKSSKSTLVTDTQTYGEDDDDGMRKEVDALIGVKHDMDEYTPRYEKENKYKLKYKKDENRDEDSDDNDDDENGNVDDDNNDNDEHSDEGDDDDDSDEEVEDEDDVDHNTGQKHTFKHAVTTPEPTKRTLAKTTIAPVATTASRARLKMQPITLKRKLEVHKELPSNKSSPHVTQFKQDIKEIEIIKEMAPSPRKRPNKDIEALNLFKDQHLIEEINKLGDVEVFRENLNLDAEPKHGGNYRSITQEELAKDTTRSGRKDDVETSESETRKLKFDLIPERDDKRSKLVELDDIEVIPKSMYGGHLKISQNNNKNEKYTELDDEHDVESVNMHGGNFKSHDRNSGRMHGGNYRNEKIVQENTAPAKRSRSQGRARDPRTSAAVVLNGFARAAPILTTPPTFILDPSKRMYYYVDA